MRKNLPRMSLPWIYIGTPWPCVPHLHFRIEFRLRSGANHKWRAAVPFGGVRPPAAMVLIGRARSVEFSADY